MAELRRLVRLQRAYLKLNEGDGWVTDGDFAKAMEAYSVAMDLVPDEATNGEAPFWVGVTLAASDQVEEAMPYLKRAYAQDVSWAELIVRLPAADLLPSQALARDLSDRMSRD